MGWACPCLWLRGGSPWASPGPPDCWCNWCIHDCSVSRSDLWGEHVPVSDWGEDHPGPHQVLQTPGRLQVRCIDAFTVKKDLWIWAYQHLLGIFIPTTPCNMICTLQGNLKGQGTSFLASITFHELISRKRSLLSAFRIRFEMRRPQYFIAGYCIGTNDNSRAV